jgi:nucleotide-binding universal stress UspA family protein
MKLVFGYDGSTSAKSALSLVQKHAQEIKAKVYIVTSLLGENVPPEASADNIGKNADAVKEAESRLEFAQKTLAKEGIICETHLLIRGLEPGEDIVKFAKEVDADFVVVGIGKTSRVGKMFTGSTAQYVILEAPCAVITTK